MRYLGGKSRTAKQIAGYIHNVIQPGQAYYEPFCGACWVTCQVYAERRFASDANASMVALWRALQDGWIPPDSVSKDEHAAAKRGEYADRPHLEAFILVGCSFGGRWGASYAGLFSGVYYRSGILKEHNYNWPNEARNGLLNKIPKLHDVTFTACDYRDIQPPPNSLIYCDPPYDGFDFYDKLDSFDSAAFWRWAQGMTEQGHTVIVSEYEAPAGWVCVAEMPTRVTIKPQNGEDTNRIERLFRYGDHERLQPVMPGFEYIVG